MGLGIRDYGLGILVLPKPRFVSPVFGIAQAEFEINLSLALSKPNIMVGIRVSGLGTLPLQKTTKLKKKAVGRFS